MRRLLALGIRAVSEVVAPACAVAARRWCGMEPGSSCCVSGAVFLDAPILVHSLVAW